MDKETLSNYGWIVICTLVLAVMIALATPFGEYVKDAVWSTTNGLNDTLNKNMEIAGLSGGSDDAGTDNSYTFYPTEMGVVDKSFGLVEGETYYFMVEHEDGEFSIYEFEARLDNGLVYISYTFGANSDATFFFIDTSIVENNLAVYSENNSVYKLTNKATSKEDRIASIQLIDMNYNGSVKNIKSTDGITFTDGSFINWENLEFPEVVDKYVWDSAFYRDTTIKNVLIPEGVTYLGSLAFYKCTSLTDIKLPSTLTYIARSALYGTAINNIEIPDGVFAIEKFAFGYCSSLTQITIPATVTRFGGNAFYNCSALTNINFKGTKAQWDAIEKGSSWNYKVPATQVTCSDGIITL